MKLCLLFFVIFFAAENKNNDCNNFIILKGAAINNGFIPNDIFIGCVGDAGINYYNDFYGENILEYNNLTMLEFSTAQNDTFIKCILVFVMDTLQDAIFLPTEKLVNYQTSIIFGDIGYRINSLNYLVVNKYTFSPVYIDSLDSKFAREIDAKNMAIDSMKFYTF